jgi:hypothetical protein
MIETRLTILKAMLIVNIAIELTIGWLMLRLIENLSALTTTANAIAKKVGAP